MKKLSLFLMAIFAITMNVRATTAETTLWEGSSAAEQQELNAETVGKFKAGEVLRFYVTVPADGGNINVVYKGESNGWSETAIPSLNNSWPWMNSGETTFDITLTDGDITALSSMGIYFKNGSATITKVTLISQEATAIKGVELLKKDNGTYFMLNGQRTHQPTQGVYIVNGKKVLVK